MSIYDSSYSGAHDNERTRRAKDKIQAIIKREMQNRGFKTWIKTEVPFTVIDPKPVCYHLDVGILFRKISEFDFYHFFGCEVDDKGHQSDKHGRKDDQRDEDFLVNKGIVTARIPIDFIFSEGNEDATKFFDKWIWGHILTSYIMMPVESVKGQLWSEINRQFAISLKENAYTQCTKCDHKAQQHDLTGCSFRLTNKSKLKCNCTNPFFRSDE